MPPLGSRTRASTSIGDGRRRRSAGASDFLLRSPLCVLDALLHHPSRLAGRGVVAGRARGTERVLHQPPRVHQVLLRLPAPGPVGVLLQALELGLARLLALVLRPRGARRATPARSRAASMLRLRLPHLSAPLLDRREQRVEVALRVRHPRLGVGQHLGLDAEPPGDREAVGAAGHALHEAVRRRERRGVELERRVHHARRVASRGP